MRFAHSVFLEATRDPDRHTSWALDPFAMKCKWTHQASLASRVCWPDILSEPMHSHETLGPPDCRPLCIIIPPPTRHPEYTRSLSIKKVATPNYCSPTSDSALTVLQFSTFDKFALAAQNYTTRFHVFSKRQLI